MDSLYILKRLVNGSFWFINTIVVSHLTTQYHMNESNAYQIYFKANASYISFFIHVLKQIKIILIWTSQVINVKLYYLFFIHKMIVIKMTLMRRTESTLVSLLQCKINSFGDFCQSTSHSLFFCLKPFSKGLYR